MLKSLDSSLSLFEGKLMPFSSFKEVKNEDWTVYEVLRILDGHPLYLKDHLERMMESLKTVYSMPKTDESQLREWVEVFLLANKIKNGNMRIDAFFDGVLHAQMYFSPHSYPTEVEYRNGVKVMLQKAERNTPNAKKVQKELRKQSNEMILQHKVYETLLVNKRREITEGSRSNIFFIKENSLYTSPDDVVLLGVTRQKIIQLCHQHNIAVHRAPIALSLLPSFDSCFLCGTSPLILPVHKIENFQMDVDHPVLRRLMSLFHDFLLEY